MILFVALSGVAVNLVATWQLAKANRQNMNVEGSFQHIVTDLYAFIGTPSPPPSSSQPASIGPIRSPRWSSSA